MATKTDPTEQAPEAPEITPEPIPATGQAVALRLTSEEIQQLLEPHTVSLRTWLQGLLSTEEFPESDAEEMAIGMIAQILLAPTSKDALEAFQLDRAKEMCGGEPGGKSPVLTITGARPLKSSFEEGAACYVIVEAVRKVDGERVRFTTGARAVQAVILKHIHEGWMPFDAMLEIRSERTRAGYYPINLVSGI